ncbi:MAG: glycosyltransferase family 39 protein [Deltaproteobacteria bacterium]|nr:glycosyltransferase family 39 protein [Deltaproteobacteria bacterium]
MLKFEFSSLESRNCFWIAGLLSFLLAAAVALIRYQHGMWGFGFEGVSFRPSPSLRLFGLATLTILVILWVFLLIRCGFPPLIRTILKNQRRYLVLLSLLFSFFLFSNICFPKFGLNLPPPTPRFFAISFRNLLIHVFWVAGVLLIAAALFERIYRRQAEALDSLRRRLMRIAGRPFPIFLCVLAITNFFAWFLFCHMPSIGDEVSMVFQSRIFAGGDLFLHPPPHVEFFALEHIMDEGRWYSVYSPGHPIMLTLGQWIGAPWLINPLAGSVSAILIYWLGKETYGEKTARLGMLLGSLSPFLWFMSASFMAHPTALLFATLFLWSAARCIRTLSPRAGLAAGLCLGMMFIIRPLTALGIGLPTALWFMARIVRRPRRTVGAAAAGLLGFAAFAALFLLYNNALTGDAFTFGYEARFGSAQSMGFGPRSWGVVHTPWRGLMNTASNLWGLNEFLFQWPIPSLCFIFIAAAARKRNPWDAFFFAPILSVMALYFFYFGQDLHLGPRYFFELIPCLCLLTSRGIRSTPAFVRGLGFRVDTVNARCFVVFLLAVSVVFALSHRVPLWMERYARFVNPRIARQVKQRGLHNALIFVDPGFRGWSGMFWNSPRLDDDVLFARDLGYRNMILRRAYPHKTCYRLVRVPADDQLYWHPCKAEAP